MILPHAQLVAIRGPLKGLSWRLTDKGILFGRSAECDVALSDPTVSRRQCRIVAREDQWYVEDLGGRNPALINGQVMKEKALGFGDELTIGGSLFVLARAEGPKGKEGKSYSTPAPTRSWRGETLCVTEDAAEEKPLDLRPRSTEDLAFLCEAAMIFSRCTTVVELFQAAREFLAKRFRPAALWVTLVQDEKGPTLFVPEGTAQQSLPVEDLPKGILAKAVQERKGLLVPQAGQPEGCRKLNIIMAAPGYYASEAVLVTAVRNKPENTVYDEEDLRMLILLTRLLAPHVRAVQHAGVLKREIERLRVLQGESAVHVGSSASMRRVLARIRQAARTDITTLLTGETGTGKELAARAIQAQSSRHNMPFVSINCAAIPRELFEGEIFGFEKGAYTGAHKASPGLLEEANGGTLFLDEIGDLSLDNQARILRVVENCSFRRLGGRQEIRVDIRFIAATNHNLSAAVKEGKFREDLFHRINAMEINLPALREHPEDIPELAAHFFNMFKAQAGHPLVGIAPDAMEYLQNQSWPGNVRELRNAIHRAVTLGRREFLEIGDFTNVTAGRDSTAAPAWTLAQLERNHIAMVFRQCGGNIQQAAALLGIARSTLYKKLAEFGIRADY